MWKYTVAELIDINELFYEAANVKYSVFNKYVYLEIKDEKGNSGAIILPKREFYLIMRNFYIADIADIIELSLDGKNTTVFTNYEDTEFPITINVYNSHDKLVKQICCNEEEYDFIHKCVRNQK